jgi:SHS2 domain-containing protein
MSYKFLEHTADIKIEAEAPSLEGAFSETASALKEVISGDIVVLSQIKKEINVKGKDLQSLLYNFLEEFLFLLDSESFLLWKVEDVKIDEKNFTLKASLIGDNAENYHFTNDVKAVTYNDMRIDFDEKKKSWKIHVVLDV